MQNRTVQGPAVALGPLNPKKMLSYNSISKRPETSTHIGYISWIIAGIVKASLEQIEFQK